MLDIRLYLLQRVTALIMAPLVVGHIAVMIVAIQGGLSTAEILSRTQGSVWWMLFYGLFVIAVSIHAAIGLRVVVHEWLGIKGFLLSLFSAIVFIGLLALGMRAVLAVTVS
ncbi:MAG: succinate dehydrogenase [Pseudomonadota bacterium]